jgi:serine protease AprX
MQMRHVVYNIDDETLSRVYGGQNIKSAKTLQMSFVDLTDANAALLKQHGYAIKEVKKVAVHPVRVKADVGPIIPIPGINIYTPTQLFNLVGVASLLNLTNPPLYGKNMTIALIDTGIRETHVKVAGHIALSMNFTSDTMEDGYDHGTGTASIIAELAPQANILNFKVLDNTGSGSEEEVALGIDQCIDMVNNNHELAPSVINISLGTEDEGATNPPSALRVACQHAVETGILVIAAAGNGGPNAETIMNPACDPLVIAVGSCDTTDHLVSTFSARGPTVEGLIKPDMVLFGENIVVASSQSDTAMAAKSGTSFSAPMASALSLLTQEGIVRKVGYTGGVPLGLRAQSVEQTLTNSKLLGTYIPQVSVKPTGIQADKDNDYGYGLPAAALINDAVSDALASQLQGGLNIDFGSMLELMLVMMIMKMMMGSMSGMGGNNTRVAQQPRMAPQNTKNLVA